MIDGALRPRLVNWAMHVRVTERPDISQTGRVLDRLARDAGQTWRTSSPTIEVDEADGQLVELAWRKCTPATKELLKWLYVRNAHPALICRMLKIPHRPKHVFDERRRVAEIEIERHLSPAIAPR